MKVILSTFLIAILGYVAAMLLPWWSLVLVALGIGLAMNLNSFPSFIAGFLGGAILWGVVAATINAGNDGLLASQMGELLGGLSGMGLVLATALIAGLLGGMGSLTGTLGRNLMKN